MTFILPKDIKPSHVEKVKAAFELSAVHDADAWIERCANDTAQLWNADKFWCITEVITTKTGRALNIAAAAGEYSRDLVKQIELWASSVGCNVVYFVGRPGWQKRHPDYKLVTVTMEKRI